MQEHACKSTAAGVLCIISGALLLSFGTVVVGAGGVIVEIIGLGWLTFVGIALIALAVLAIVGGVYAFKRRMWGLALTGSICVLITGNVVFGIPAVLLVSLGKDDFA